MSNKKAQRLRRILGALTGVFLAVAAICLAAACVRIYREGEFTRQIVAERFQPIALPVYLSLALSVIGLAADLFIPQPEAKADAADLRSLVRADRLSRLSARADLAACDPALLEQITAQRKARRRKIQLRASTIQVCSALFLMYALNGRNFHTSQINASMIRAMAVLLPCLILPLLVSVFVECFNEKSMDAELSLLKKAPKKAAPAQEVSRSKNKAKLLRIGLLCLAAVLLAVGYCTGGTADVLTKAVNICTECVGLG